MQKAKQFKTIMARLRNAARLIAPIVFLLAISTVVIAQVKKHNIIGLWQVDSPQTGDALLANYRFFPNGTFKYTLNAYDDRGRIAQARGTYKLKGDTLTIIIKSRIERVGGELVGGSMGFQQEEIVLEGGKNIEVKQKDLTPIVLLIDWFNSKGVKGFKVQNNKYFQISADPHKDEEL
jgi:hypothetical protein